MKPGDIFASRNRGLGSWLIRSITRSNWSHVAIATASDRLLEAVPTSDRKDEVREVCLADFLNRSDQVKLFERPHQLSKKQLCQLSEFAQSIKLKKYTIVHAGLTMLGSFIWALAWVFFILSAIDLLSLCKALEASFDSYLLALMYVGLLLTLWAVITVWSLRTNFGVPTTERLMGKTRFGRYLVRVKHDMFCSKLVALAEKEIGGRLFLELPAPEETLPRHIVEACQKMGWSP